MYVKPPLINAPNKKAIKNLFILFTSFETFVCYNYNTTKQFVCQEFYFEQFAEIK